MLNEYDNYSGYLCYRGVCHWLSMQDGNNEALVDFYKYAAGGKMGIISRHAVASEMNMWQTCGTQLEMVTVTDVVILISSH